MLALLGQSMKGQGPVELRRAAHAAELLGLDLPRRVGGMGLSSIDMVRVFRAAGRVDLELRDTIGAGHARMLTHVASRRFDAFLGDVVGGRAFCAVAITEPNVGSDIQAVAATAEPVNGGYLLSGVKQHISRIVECSHFIVFAGVHRGGGPLVSAFLVPRRAEGLHVEPASPMGMANVSWGRVNMSAVQVPASNRVGGEGQAISLFMQHFSYWRTLMAAAAIGSAQAVVDLAAERMRTRSAFGGPIGRFTHLQQALAEHTARLRMTWLLIEDVASRFDHGWPTFDAAMAKAESMEAAIAATEWAMTIHGAAGYDTENGLEKRYRDLLGMRIADGTTDVLRGQVARAVLGERMYELSLGRASADVASRDNPRRLFW